MQPIVSFSRTGPDQLIHEIAMPLIATRERGEECVGGTAFLIAPGWAVTAFHVLDEFVRRFGGRSISDGEIPSSFNLVAYLRADRGERIIPLSILRLWRATPLDLAVLAVGIPPDLPTSHRWKIPEISLLPPRRGTPIVAFGFTRGDFTSQADDGPPVLTVDSHTATGQVLEVHHAQRDTVMAPFPCFRTNADFAPGMSGGPIIDKTTGRVCGVVCSGLPDPTGGENTSYGSALWPIVGTSIDATESHWTGGVPRPLIDLFTQGTIRAADIDRVRVVRTENGMNKPHAAYDAAEWDRGTSE